MSNPLYNRAMSRERKVKGELGHALDERMVDAGLSPTKLDALSGISRASIYTILGGHIPEPETLRKLAEGIAKRRRTGVVDQDAYVRLWRELYAAAGYPLAGLPDAGGTAEQPEPAPAPVVYTRYPGSLKEILRVLDGLPNQAEADRLTRIAKAFAEDVNSTSPLARAN